MRQQSGQSLFEVVFAVGMSALIVVTIVVLAAKTISNSTFSKNKALAERYTTDAIEWLRGERDANWQTFYGYALITRWCLPALNWDQASANDMGCGDNETITTDSNFKREISFSTDDFGNVWTVVKVYWEDAKGLHDVSTTTNFTDWRRQ